MSLLGTEVLHLSLDVVQQADALQSLPGDLAGAIGMQVEELAPRMRHAAHLGDAIGKAGLVATVVVANQAASPVTQEGARMPAAAAVGKALMSHSVTITFTPVPAKATILCSNSLISG